MNNIPASVSLPGGLSLSIRKCVKAIRKTKSISSGQFVLQVLLCLWACQSPTLDRSGVVFCDAEKVRNDNFVNSGAEFRGGDYQSDEIAFGGKYSCKLSKGSQFGMTHVIEQVDGGDLFEVEVWRYRSSGYGKLVVSGSWNFHQEAFKAVETSANGWEKLVMTVKVPTYVNNGTIKFYVWNPWHEPVYFDDLKITMVDDRTEQLALGAYRSHEIPTLELLIKTKGMEKLQRKREQAFDRGLLITEKDDYVKAKMVDGHDTIPVRLRLKGDWLDHLKGNKWSFRIKTRKGKKWNGMATFSIQNPMTRDFLSEWVFHRLLAQEDVLTTRYEFIHIKLNGQNLGLYVYEEHFDKHLPEYRKRREGPIVRFTEDGFWERKLVDTRLKSNTMNKMPYFDAASVKPFKTNRTLRSETLKQQFLIAQDLMHTYKSGKQPFAQVFDLDNTARYFALIDLTNAYHGMTWHNQRFYYNPVTALLEPIGFDGYGLTGPSPLAGRPFLGYAQNETHKPHDFQDRLVAGFFYDPQFVAKYNQYLYRFTSDAYIGAFFDSIISRLDHLEAVIRKEFPDYQYNRNFLWNNARNIHALIFPVKEITLRAYRKEHSKEGHQLQMANFHFLPLNIIGTGSKPGIMSDTLDQPYFMGPYDKHLTAQYQFLDVAGKPGYVFYAIPGLDSLFEAKVMPWDLRKSTSPRQELFSRNTLGLHPMIKTSGNRVIVKAGNHTVSRDIIIPKGYKVVFEPGVRLNLIKRAKFISASPVKMIGNEDQPVRIWSSDRTANGFTVLQAAERSFLNYVAFDQLTTLDYKGWTLTGAVNFYESDVTITNCSFTNNDCEDGLNIIRSDLKIDNSLIAHAKFDGLDADFCTGTISGLYINQAGNDGLDFSGSVIKIQSSEIKGVKDKGISIGEDSKCKILETRIEAANIGIAAKDNSDVYIDRLDMKSCKIGYAVFQKKAEFGPAAISIKTHTTAALGQLFLLDKNSIIDISGEKSVGSVGLPDSLQQLFQ